MTWLTRPLQMSLRSALFTPLQTAWRASQPLGRLTHLAHLRSGRCVLCGSWGNHTVCTACLHDWAPPGRSCPRCALPWPVRGLSAGPGDDMGNDLCGDHLNGARIPQPLEAAATCLDVCADCESHGPEFDRAVAALPYAAPWSGLIGRLKFQQAAHLGAPLGRLLADAVRHHPTATLGGLPDVVLPVPLSAPRLRERGFNQAWLLARHCAQHLGLPAQPHVLQRTQHSARLMTLDAEARALALRDAFVVDQAGQHWVEGAHVALVDDVLTTGATLNAACMALREAGAARISVWVLARTGRDHPDHAASAVQAREPLAPWPAAA